VTEYREPPSRLERFVRTIMALVFVAALVAMVALLGWYSLSDAAQDVLR
jgi:hypothetical protein